MLRAVSLSFRVALCAGAAVATADLTETQNRQKQDREERVKGELQTETDNME